ncbi:hypothetical protein DFH28DRAFT_887670, partial [Melampsora americana]
SIYIYRNILHQSDILYITICVYQKSKKVGVFGQINGPNNYFLFSNIFFDVNIQP